MKMSLNELVEKYLEQNGISNKFFANYIGIDCSIVTKWFQGTKNLPKNRYVLVHKFLESSYKTPEEIIKAEENKSEY